MAMDKIVSSAAAAVADIPDGATILVGGFGVMQGWPTSLLTFGAATTWSRHYLSVNGAGRFNRYGRLSNQNNDEYAIDKVQ